MIISVINGTSLHRQEVQDVIRAVNRQLQEDFKQYWHRDVMLRLEGWTGEDPDPNYPLDMRGDAVLYLWDEADVAGALGYHALTYQGVPFGFVFTDLAKELKEPWSVTLSHEALEMAMDPEINLLVQGPHPDPAEAGRTVYHWYELCDAVQSETYEIDGVHVSNFVLPLYFTEGEEHTNHNDYLGLGVPSFGVNAGGYVGFYDPYTGDHENYVSDKKAQKRHDIKAKLKEAKRSTRRDVGKGLNDTRQLWCEAIVVGLADGVQLDQCRSQLQNVLSDDWLIGNIGFVSDEVDVVYQGKTPLSFGNAWELAHELADLQGVDWCEPSLVHPIPGETDRPDDDLAVRGFSLFGEDHLPEAEGNTFWAPEMCKVQEAWKLFEGKDVLPGEGVVIGHPDSGFNRHQEMDLDRVRLGLDRDFLDDDDDAETGKLKHGSHGLSTASVIMSGLNSDKDKLYGAAQYSTIVPLRVTDKGLVRPTPVLFWGGMRRLRDSIYYATDIGCGVISMSLGGVPSKSLRKAVQYAVSKGVIVLNAAGNRVRTVVWPARYPETIAVAACNARREPWSGSCRGKAVDFTAPGESVWRATHSKNGAEIVSPSSGTSYAVAMTAGIAALWRSYFAEELKSVAPHKIQDMFRDAVQSTVDTAPELNPKKFGPGIINAEKLLKKKPKKSAKAPEDDFSMRASLKELGVKVPRLDEGLEMERLQAEVLSEFLTESSPQSGRAQVNTESSVPVTGLSRRLQRKLSQ